MSVKPGEGVNMMKFLPYALHPILMSTNLRAAHLTVTALLSYLRTATILPSYSAPPRMGMSR
jgi:hypothetical protein